MNEFDGRLFSRSYLKPLRAQVLADALSQVTGVGQTFEGHPEVKWATALPDSQVASFTLDVFGRCPRQDSCEAPENFGGGLTQALHFINGNQLNANLRNGAVARLVKRESDDAKVIRALYLRTLSRNPSETEAVHWEERARQAESRIEFFEDLTWALINSSEFAFNH